jgi:hypothetical protein
MRSIRRAGTVAALVGLAFVGSAGGGEGGGGFQEATVSFEQNATDGDVEVVFSINSGGVGIERLSVTGPDGRKVIDFGCQAPTNLGMRQFRFESPEPKDSGPLKKDFPEGDYRFEGTAIGGARMTGAASLSHALPSVTSFLHPEEDAEDVSCEDLVIRWKAVPGVAAYTLEIAQDETGANLAVRLPASSTSFTTPPGFLAPGLEYQLGIGTVTEGGNLSVVETGFTTAE